MDCHHDLAFVALLTLVPIEVAPLFGQPFSECCAFHCPAPAVSDNLPSEIASLWGRDRWLDVVQ
jgi:hypothetical protein